MGEVANLSVDGRQLPLQEISVQFCNNFEESDVLKMCCIMQVQGEPPRFGSFNGFLSAKLSIMCQWVLLCLLEMCELVLEQLSFIH